MLGHTAIAEAPIAALAGASNPQTVTPDVAVLTLTTFAPVVTAGVRVEPTTASFTLTTFAPTVSLSQNQRVVPTTAALVLTTFAPTVTVGSSNAVTVIPATAFLTLIGYAPDILVAQLPVGKAVVSLISVTEEPQVATESTAAMSLRNAS